MAKSKRKSAARKKNKASAAAPTPEMTRRDTLRLLRNGALGVGGLAIAGYFGVRSFSSFTAEHDLSRVGQGTPSVVQVHDPQCPTCTALQRETRAALSGFEDADLIYLVADILTEEGQDFAFRHNVPHVTLLLFDGAGNLTQTLRGMRNRDELETEFQAHFDRYKGA